MARYYAINGAVSVVVMSLGGSQMFERIVLAKAQRAQRKKKKI